MGAMSIVSKRSDKGMEITPGSSEPSWLEVVKAAASSKKVETGPSAPSRYSKSVKPLWILQPGAQTGTHQGPVGDLIERLEGPFDWHASAGATREEDEQELAQDLQEKLAQKTLTKESFIQLLGPYLATFKNKEVVVSNSAPHTNGASAVIDEDSTFLHLRRVLPKLSPGLISVLVECCTVLRLWSFLLAMVLKRAVSGHDFSKLVESAIEDEQAKLLVHGVTWTPDISPQALHAILSFFLNSVERTPKSFLLVKGEWKRLALSKIERHNDPRRGRKRYSLELILSLAAAYDKFSPPELCIHHIVASEIDEGVLSSVVSNLETSQLRSLLQYLSKWLKIYFDELVRYPISRHNRVPSMEQVLRWTSVILEVNYTNLVLFADYHEVIRILNDKVQADVELDTVLSPLLGIVDGIQTPLFDPITGTHLSMPTTNSYSHLENPSSSDYVIELLDFS